MSKITPTVNYVKKSSHAGGRDSTATHWVPNTDVYVTDTGLVIKVELAGMRRDDLELTVDGNHLVISGFRQDGCRTSKCNFLIMEIHYGAFESVIEIPSGYDLGQAKASYQNGFLRVDVPHVPHPKKAVSLSITGDKEN